jgi:flagellar hook-associated protein 3 FlgL
MSGSLNSIYNNVSYALYLHSIEMARLQEQTTTGSRINRPSDDPSNAYRVVTLNSQEKSLENYINNLSDMIDTLDLSSTSIQEIESALSDVKVRLTQIISGTYPKESRKDVAKGINDILEQVVSLANTKNMGQYLFGGNNTTSAPYLVERANGEITSVTYQGDFENRQVEVAPGIKSSAFCVGNNIFSSNDRSDPIFLGDTGAKAGTGTSNVQGDTWLTVSGTPGNYTLSIDDGLSTFNTDGTDTNLAVTDPRTGKILYVDTTEINSPGIELVSIPGTYDVFNTLISIRDILKNERGLSEAQMRDLQQNSLNALGEVNKLLVNAEVSVGSKTGFLDNLKDSLDKLKYNAEDQATAVQQADVAQIAVDLSRREILYQMSLSVAGKLMSVSLLDFLS